MPTLSASPQRPSSRSRLLVPGVLACVLAVRLLHLSFAMLSPLTYQLGPDEDYYQRFGEAVATGHGQNGPEFTFMDPAYGYLLGGVFRLFGVNLFVVYLLQTLLDTATSFGIFAIGRVLGRPRAGLYGAMLYGLTSTAIMFCTTVLKEVWVTSYVTWWTLAAFVLIRSERRWPWLVFGFYCAVGVALRSTLLLLSVAAVLLPALCAQPAARKLSNWAGKSALVACGLIAGLLPWSLRNDHAFGSLSPLPHNGGIVLHQVYNAENPGAGIWIPAFVNYSHPSEIWRGYAAEARARVGRPLSPPEVDQFWRDESLTFMRRHPDQVLGDLWRKNLTWFSSPEVPSSRYDVEERLFSPVLQWLPPPGAGLLALGLAGLVWLALEERRWPIVAAPIVIAWFTFVVFFAESRFRFHAASMLALCPGSWIDQIGTSFRKVRPRRSAIFVALAGLIAAASIYLGSRTAQVPVRWDHIVWGYINMGKIPEAQAEAERIEREQPNNAAILEALGYIAATRHQYDDAVRDLRRAIELRPRSYVAHYNLARVLLAMGDRSQAAAEAKIAVQLNPSADYQQLLSQIDSSQ